MCVSCISPDKRGSQLSQGQEHWHTLGVSQPHFPSTPGVTVAKMMTTYGINILDWSI